jgi:prepilin peptidase CpaA
VDSGLIKEVVISSGAVGLSAWAAWLDWRARRIPNWLTVPALFIGLVLSAAFWRWPGLKSSLQGVGIGLGVLLPFVLVRGIGAGDWKLMGALGAYLGPYRLAVVLFGTVLITGAMSIVEVIRQHRVLETLQNLWVLVVAFSTFHINNARSVTLDNPGLLKVPFGVAAALSTAAFFAIISVLRFFHALG